jgi:CRISPR-associated protein Cmr6
VAERGLRVTEWGLDHPDGPFPAEGYRPGRLRFGQDAFPTEPPGFELDVMNVHYPEYYRGDAPEALDIESPNPVVFLTVARTPFRFWVLVDALRAGQEADPILDAVGQALQASGIGGKTRLGYGRFKGK